MIKKLILCRHAQAEPALMGQPDFNRQLTFTGELEATEAGKKAAKLGFMVNHLVASTAERAFKTAEFIAKQLDNLPVKQEGSIYEATTQQLLNLVNSFPEDAQAIIMVGHNPGISDLAGYLTGHRFDLEPSQIVVLELEAGSWAAVSGNSARVYR